MINNKISNIFTLSDKALGIVMIENIVEDIRSIKSDNTDIQKGHYNNRYTNSDKGIGWSKMGIKRFNEVYKLLKDFEGSQRNVIIDDNLLKHYREVCDMYQNDNTNQWEGQNSKLLYDSEDSEEVEGIYEMNTMIGI